MLNATLYILKDYDVPGEYAAEWARSKETVINPSRSSCKKEMLQNVETAGDPQQPQPPLPPAVEVVDPFDSARGYMMFLYPARFLSRRSLE